MAAARPPPVAPPATVAELLARAEALAGRRLAEVAAPLRLPVPTDLRRHKGWVGQLAERALGATAGSRDVPDFEQLGVELKTLPVDDQGLPVESTFVCTVPLSEVGELPWRASRARRKLARVLWLPVQGLRTIPVGDRRLGAPVLWSPSAEEERALQEDWEQLAGIIGRGDVEAIDGRIGRVLQVRPKAAHGRVRRRSIDAEGRMRETLPRGFYLRPSFTAAIIRSHFGRAGASRNG